MVYDIMDYDIELWDIVKKEINRQERHIDLVASENYISIQAMKAQGSQLTNKYAEGYPGKRYYGGCKYVDLIEQLAIDRAKVLFTAEYVNVQPHSGSQANFSVFNALLDPGDTILGMHLYHGGHLTHGSKVNFSGKLYKTIFYGVDKFGCIDYEQLCFLTERYRPKMIIGGFSAYSGIVDWARMRRIADSVGAYFFVDMAHIAGLVAAGVYPNPIPYAHVVTATTHKTLAGPRGGIILSNGDNDIEFYRKLDASVFPGSQGGPLMHVIAAKAVAFKEAMHVDFKRYQKQVIINSQKMAKEFLNNGFTVVSGIPYNHLFILDLTNHYITGKDASLVLERANIIVNKNCIPNDSHSPFITSGIRIGTAAVTRRGFNDNDVQEVARWICNILNDISNEKIILNAKKNVLDICYRHPVY
ncbi:serine hydroxymethyltransferase [Candidatus Blochmanniella floridana]|uniref:Serine hydroxymethyltransferase n=1 Tax=Blochmanniella floridana TaxID=203907 RepID=GLYA_BLOFL|nr:RecName: Full=Serine hydroxymethyltransferase; Short=SHMT; Short=Serine methylase [Candidatus Blochmannia floridanus]CAD83222.1 serine hydroxymethyltransferase [Candidatus Blochmannia floridanus]